MIERPFLVFENNLCLVFEMVHAYLGYLLSIL